MRKRLDDAGLNMTPMIDVVFQLIIFFVTTADMQNKEIDRNLKLTLAPHGQPVTVIDPRTINVNVDKDGKVTVANTWLSIPALKTILRKAVAEYGPTTPVVIRGDGRTKHEDIRLVMDACTSAGMWKIKFAAVREENTKKSAD